MIVLIEKEFEDLPLQKIIRYAVINELLVVFDEYDSVQMAFDKVSLLKTDLTESQLYNEISEVKINDR